MLFCASPSQVGVAMSLNCSAGSYHSDPDSSCRVCGICPENELLTEPCTPIRNTICHCKPGYYRLYPTWSFWLDTCMECSSCGNRPVVANCTESHNTLCGDCPLYYFLYNDTFCAPCSVCSEGDPFAIRMKDCREAGLPPWQQCSPKMVTSSGFIFNTTIPSKATQPTFLTSSTVDAVNNGGVQDPTDGIIIAGAVTVSLTGVMVSVSVLACLCCTCAMYRPHCAQCRRRGNGPRLTCCWRISSTQRSRTSSVTRITPASDAEALSEFTPMYEYTMPQCSRNATNHQHTL